MKVKGKNIIISTQPKEQAELLHSLLQSTYFLFYSMPLIETKILKSNPDNEQVLRTIQSFDWIVFTSKRGVFSFFELTKSLNIKEEDIAKLQFAAIGTATAGEIFKNGYQVHYINKGNTSKEFAAYLIDDVIQPKDKILLPQGNLAPDFLLNKLSEKAKCTRINIYETLKIKNPDKEILNLIENNNYDLLIFTSPSAFENFLEITKYQADNKKLKILSIGQTTTDFIENKGFKVKITAKKSNIKGLADEIIKHLV
ncbi:MAG: uroporphyrinogen-III synthase [Bacteroidales bacterium]|nr:uroporphyrinogen-III synthase [Bacteroidales bacterium]